MNIIAIMGPHGVFYKDEPIKELESALVAQGFQIILPQNSVDLLKFIEHNPRICGVIFDWDEYSLDLCSDINQLNEYLPLYAFINTHSTMDVSVQDMRMALWFFEYALGQAEDIAIRMRQYTDEYLDNITPPFTKALFTYVKERKYTFCTPGHMGGTAYQKSPVGCLFYDFSAGIPSRLMSLFRSPSLVRCSTTPGHTWKRKSTSRGLLARNRVISLPTEHRRRTKLWVCTPRHPAVRC